MSNADIDADRCIAKGGGAVGCNVFVLTAADEAGNILDAVAFQQFFDIDILLPADVTHQLACDMNGHGIGIMGILRLGHQFDRRVGKIVFVDIPAGLPVCQVLGSSQFPLRIEVGKLLDVCVVLIDTSQMEGINGIAGIIYNFTCNGFGEKLFDCVPKFLLLDQREELGLLLFHNQQANEK